MQVLDPWQHSIHVLKLVSSCYHYQGIARQILPFYLHLSCFLPQGAYLSYHSWIMPPISHLISCHSGWQTRSQPSSMSVCTYVLGILFTHRQTFNQRKHTSTLHRLSEHCAAVQPHCLVKLLQQQNILINYVGTSVRKTMIASTVLQAAATNKTFMA